MSAREGPQDTRGETEMPDYQSLETIPAGRWFAVWDIFNERWCTGQVRDVIFWTKAPRSYDRNQCLLLPEVS